MLVLSRKKNQVIHIGTDIEVEVLAIVGGRVRLGIRAPREIPIDRAEIRDPIVDETDKPIPLCA